MHIRCPHCRIPLDVADQDSLSEITCPTCGSAFNLLSGDATEVHHDKIQRVAHFELLDRVGLGAFGAVWKARDTVLQRTVAVKIPRRGQVTADEAEYFFRDARAAAQLTHPNIVSVYEVGRDGDTLYIASKFIEGGTLADWIQARPVTPREAAEVMVKVTHAIQHAHERGVIHRDLKPGNILLDTDAEPHVTDFGLAKRDAGEITMTVDGQVLGTPAYMSPEQARGQGHLADARSDVYSLGVILYQLLTGELPFRGSKAMLVAQILNDEPPSPRRLAGRVPRDLETICLTAMAKEPGRRYATAQLLADDLNRYLLKQPILARPVGRVERAWRWCKRNSVVAALAATVIVALVTGAAVSTLFAVRAKARESEAIGERNRAEEEKTRADNKTTEALVQKARANEEKKAAEEASNILVGLFQGADPIGLGGYHLGALGGIDIDVKALELLDRGAEYVQKSLENRPELQAKLLNSIGDVYTSHFKFDAAEPLLNKALAIRRERFGKRDPQVADSLHSLAVFHFLEGDFEGCETVCREALSIRREHFGKKDLKVALSEFVLGWDLLFSVGRRTAEAEALIHAALKTRLEVHGEYHRDVGLTRLALAFAHFKNQKPLLAPFELARALDVLNRTDGDSRGAEALSLYIEGLVNRQFGRQAEATKNLQAALERVAAIFGAHHPVANYLKREMADLQFDGRDDAVAERMYKEALESNRLVLGRRPFVAREMQRFADFLAKRGRYGEAEAVLDEAMDIQLASVGPRSGAVAGLWWEHARHAERRGDLRKASQCVAQAMRIYSKTNLTIYGEDLWHAAEWMSRLALYFDDAPLYREACIELVKAYASPTTHSDRIDPKIADRTAWVCVLLPDAISDFAQAVQIAEEAVAADPQNFWFCRTLGAALYRTGRIEESLRRLYQSIELKGDDDEASIRLFLAMAHSKAGQRDKAQMWLDKARPWLVSRIPDVQATTDGAALFGDDGAARDVQPLPWDHGAALKHLLHEAEEQARR